jgi:hypothetical protein
MSETKGGEANMGEMLTTKEVAELLETTPKTLRVFLRGEIRASGGVIGEDSPGRGGRYGIQSTEIAGLRVKFGEWLELKNRVKAVTEVEQTEE